MATPEHSASNAQPSGQASATTPVAASPLGEFNVNSVAFDAYQNTVVVGGATSDKASDVPKAGVWTSLSKGDGKTFKCLILGSKTWGSPNVGVFIDIPLSGTPGERLLVGSLIVYNFQKLLSKLYHMDIYGTFNARMRADGAEYFNVFYTIAEDGIPSEVKVSFTAIPRKAGSLTGKLLGRVLFAPPASDLSMPDLAAFERDQDSLHWAAKKAFALLATAPILCMIGGKKRSIAKNALDKFENSYKKNCKPPTITGGSAPKGIGNLLEMVHPFLYDVRKLKHVSAHAIIAQALSVHGHVYADGKSIGTFCTPDYVKYAVRATKKVLNSEAKIYTALKWFERASKKDPIGGDSMQMLIAISAVGNGLAISMAKEILGEKDVTVEKLAKEVAALTYEAVVYQPKEKVVAKK